MAAVTASAYGKRIGHYQALAQREPVVITSHGLPITVLISAAEYRRLARRRPSPMEDLPEADWQANEQANETLKADLTYPEGR